MKYLVLLSILFASTNARGEECKVQCPVNAGNVANYFEADHFQWSDPDDVEHVLIGFGGTLVIATALEHYAKLPAWESALIGAVVMSLVGVTKETLFDTYTSRTDIKAYAGGALAGGLTFTVLHF